MFRLLLLPMLLSLAPSSVLAKIVAEQHVEKEVTIRAANGEERVERIKAETVVPGEQVIYSLRFSNKNDEPANAVVLVMPVPQEVSYMEGTVAGRDANVTFSADGGQTYVARGRLTVAEEGMQRPANSTEITHIKWTLKEALPANTNSEVSFRAVLK